MNLEERTKALADAGAIQNARGDGAPTHIGLGPFITTIAKLEAMSEASFDIFLQGVRQAKVEFDEGGAKFLLALSESIEPVIAAAQRAHKEPWATALFKQGMEKVAERLAEVVGMIEEIRKDMNP